MLQKIILLVVGIILLFQVLPLAQTSEIIENVYERERMNMNGGWKLIIDPMETGLKKRGYRRDFPADQTTYLNEGALLEYEWDSSPTINVPGDWNSQFKELEWYEGLVWYRNKFEIPREQGYRYLLYFEAVNYLSHVYLNGKKLGMHEGGFTPFQFDVTKLLKKDNSLVLAVDNKRRNDAIPSKDFDWWNYGGITRPVWIVKVPETYVIDYTLSVSGEYITGNVKLKGSRKANHNIILTIPALKISQQLTTNSEGFADFRVAHQGLVKWDPDNPVRYQVTISAAKDTITDRIGFRTITTEGSEIFINGKPIFLRGICIHEEAIGKPTRTLNWESAEQLLKEAKNLNANFVRLAHYPHTEKMTRLADSLGLMVWSEIPVYWEDIDYQNPKTLALAKNMLVSNFQRDKNRASVIIWSVANETPISDDRNAFLKELISTIRNLDKTRLITAALKVSHKGGTKTIDDPLGAYLDILSINQYVGWYGTGYPDKITDVKWESNYTKPMLFSEFGAGALYGNHGDKMTRWTEEFQAYFIDETMKMAMEIPFLQGTMPWILKDFRTPRRYHGEFQQFWNRKGLINEEGKHKMAYEVLQNWYQKIKK